MSAMAYTLGALIAGYTAVGGYNGPVLRAPGASNSGASRLTAVGVTSPLRKRAIAATGDQRIPSLQPLSAKVRFR
jgi:hypothetical protein